MIDFCVCAASVLVLHNVHTLYMSQGAISIPYLENRNIHYDMNHFQIYNHHIEILPKIGRYWRHKRRCILYTLGIKLELYVIFHVIQYQVEIMMISTTTFFTRHIFNVDSILFHINESQIHIILVLFFAILFHTHVIIIIFVWNPIV